LLRIHALYLCRWYGEERGIEKRDVLFEKVGMP
jgi:hypothetical protein